MGVIGIFDTIDSTTGTAPSAATEGVPLDFVKSWRIIVSANAGQTLAGAGSVDVYHYNATTGWAKNPDLALTMSVSGARNQAFADVLVGPPVGRMKAVPNGVTVSSGSTVGVRYELGG